jgi:serine/threonine protein kinase
LKPGEVLGDRFLITHVIEGGMGIVYFAVDLSKKYLGALVLKTLRQELSDGESVRRFEVEATIWIRLQRGHFMLELLGIERIGPSIYLVMPQLAGGTLRGRLEHGVPAYLDTITWMSQILIAMRRLGVDEGLVHRDIKPENVLLDEINNAYITDLGIAKDVKQRINLISNVATEPAQSSVTQGFIGTVLYASPEQVMGRSVDTRSDIWAFGALLHELLTGRMPFFDEDILRCIKKVCSQPLPDSWASTEKAIPSAMAAIILKCLSKFPVDRYQNFDELMLSWDQIIFIPGNTPKQAALNDRVCITHPLIKFEWDYRFPERANDILVSVSKSRWVALKRCSEYRKLEKYEDAAACATAALSEPGKPMILAKLLFTGGYERHIETLLDDCNRLCYPPASVMVLLLHQWFISCVGKLCDKVKLTTDENKYLQELSMDISNSDLGYVHLLNTAAQAMHLLKQPFIASNLIQQAMAKRVDAGDWQVHLAIEASKRTIDELREVVIDIFDKFFKTEDARAKHLCGSACQLIGKWDFAAQFWEAKFKLDPTDIRALEQSRVCYKNAGWDDEAERVGRKIASLTSH